MEDLGGIVKGKKATYQVKVEQLHPPRGTVWTDALYGITVSNEETGEQVFYQRFRMRKGNTPDHLREFVDDIKDAARRDAY